MNSRNKIALWVLTMILSSYSTASARFMVIAHRGASAYAPENTLSSFRKAIELKANFLELDIHESKDGEVVVIHDSSVNRTTDGKGHIRDLSLAEIKRLDAGSKFSAQFKDERIPTLEEVFAMVSVSADKEVQIIVEFKDGDPTYPQIEEKTIALVKKYALENRVIWKSFRLSVLKRLKISAPSIPQLNVFVFALPQIDFVLGKGPPFEDLLKWDGLYLQPHSKFLTSCFVKKAQKNDHQVIAWGVNSDKAMSKMLDFGVDGIETNHPDVLIQKLHERGIE